MRTFLRTLTAKRTMRFILISSCFVVQWTATCRAGLDTRSHRDSPLPATEFPSHGYRANSQLRSAYLGPDIWFDKNNRLKSRGSVQRQLQRHFAVVLDYLITSTPTSIAASMADLELEAGSKWSPAQRAAWREFLLRQRYVQIRRLLDYARGGVFPLNEGESPTSTPIFVDRYGTDCAVGYLMRESGWGREVAAIATARNLVYVLESGESPVSQWVRYSGLTLHEAAMIQPGYPIRATTTLQQMQVPEATLSDSGLIVRNFSIKRSSGSSYLYEDELEGPQFFQQVYWSPLVQHDRPADVGLRLGSGRLSEGHGEFYVGTFYQPALENWLFAGYFWEGIANPNIDDPDDIVPPPPVIFGLRGPDAGHQAVKYVVDYDLEVSDPDPNVYLNKVALRLDAHLSHAFAQFGSYLQFETTAFAQDGTRVGSIKVGNFESTAGSSLIDGLETLNVHARRLHLRTTILAASAEPAEDGVTPSFSIGSYFHEFELVPEPSGLSLGGMMLVAMTFSAVRRRRADAV